MTGCGKTTVGKVLAEKLDWAFVDTDEWIERNFGAIDQIFAEYGDNIFYM